MAENKKTKITNKNKRKKLSLDIVVVVLICYSLSLTAITALFDFRLTIIATVFNLIIAALILLFLKYYKKLIRSVLFGKKNDGNNTEHNLSMLSINVVIVINKKMVWYNNAFLQDILKGSDACLESIYKLFPSFDMAKSSLPTGQELTLDNKSYTVYSSGIKNDENMLVLYFINDTQLKNYKNEYLLSRPCVLHISLDTYDEMKNDLKESQRAKLISDINFQLEAFVDKTSGFMLRTAADRYVAVMEERHIQRFIDERFDILEKVRQAGGDYSLTTISIGVGRDAKTFKESELMATNALDMALGRGGDQVAVKNQEGYTFFGGTVRGVEKRSKVKARIIANALTELIELSDSVICMGHKMSDMDCVGAAAGIVQICKELEKPACIAINKKATLASSLIEMLSKNGFEDSMYSPEEIMPLITKNTLLVVVDTHLPQLLESTQLYQLCKNVVVIDHHRKMVGHIENSIIFYHEPYVSSACELVSEILQYSTTEKSKTNQAVADALLAGIMLDTREFSVHTGVRTFEAAAYLRRIGAKTVVVKKLFSEKFETYKYKYNIVSMATMYQNCAISLCSDLPQDMRVIIPQAANDLLLVEGVLASFVVVDLNQSISISARSMGDVNVQIIMEALGGGGHLTMAGAQLKDVSLEKAREMLENAISQYWADKKIEETR